MKLKIFLLICLLSFGVNVYSQRSKTEPLKIGELAPDFVLKDQNGQEVKLSKLKQNVMLIFYRGYW
jgi:cytochrome oxidase Cu insertion factor (SCO1/SenC/PrrC family)